MNDRSRGANEKKKTKPKTTNMGKNENQQGKIQKTNSGMEKNEKQNVEIDDIYIKRKRNEKKNMLASCFVCGFKFFPKLYDHKSVEMPGRVTMCFLFESLVRTLKPSLKCELSMSQVHFC